MTVSNLFRQLSSDVLFGKRTLSKTCLRRWGHTSVKKPKNWIPRYSKQNGAIPPKVCPHTQTHMKIQIINKSHHPLPSYATALSAGMDLRANISSSVTLKPLERYLVPTGIYIALPAGYEGQVRPRSGLATKRGITVVNAPGTIDADYRGEIGVVLINLSQEDFTINDGERIAQLVVARYEQVEFSLVETLDETERGEGGYGHTGVK